MRKILLSEECLKNLQNVYKSFKECKYYFNSSFVFFFCWTYSMALYMSKCSKMITKHLLYMEIFPNFVNTYKSVIANFSQHFLSMYCSIQVTKRICWPMIISRSLKHVKPCNIIWNIVKAKKCSLLFSHVPYLIRENTSSLHTIT